MQHPACPQHDCHVARSPIRAPRGEKAFTLIELIIVVGICLFLAAITLPSLGRATNKARDAQCLQNLRSLATAGMLFCADQNGRFPSEVWHSASAEGSILPYLEVDKKNRPLSAYLSCPRANRKYPSGNTFERTYALNNYARGFKEGNRELLGEITRLSGITKPSEMIFFSDSVSIEDYPSRPGKYDHDALITSAPENSDALCQKLHDGKMNVAFFDGSVRALDIIEVSKIKPRSLLWKGVEEK